MMWVQRIRSTLKAMDVGDCITYRREKNGHACAKVGGVGGKGSVCRGGVREQPSTVSEDDTYNEEYS